MEAFFRVCPEDATTYVASKGAVLAFTKALAIADRRSRLCVGDAAPGERRDEDNRRDHRDRHQQQ
jgi:hypothetical protein